MIRSIIGTTEQMLSDDSPVHRRLALRHQPPPTWSNKALRALWSVVWVLLYYPSPRVFHAWRRLLLRAFGARIGRKAKPYPGLKVWAPWNLTMRDGSVLADGVDCYSVDHIEIGAGAVVSQRAFLCSATRDYNDPASPLMTAPIRVSAAAWIAAEAFVGPGVDVGEGAVVGARAVVTKDVEAWSVVAGNPARRIGLRKLKD